MLALDSTLAFGDSTEVSFTRSGIPTLWVSSPQSVIVYRRPVPGTGPFQPLQTRFDPALGMFVASGLTGFGELVLATDQSVGVDEEPAVPSAFMLSLAYPNPFGATTRLALAMPASGQTKVTAHDALGRQVADLLDRELAAGTHTVRFDGRELVSGVYVIRAVTAHGTQSRSVTHMR